VRYRVDVAIALSWAVNQVPRADAALAMGAMAQWLLHIPAREDAVSAELNARLLAFREGDFDALDAWLEMAARRVDRSRGARAPPGRRVATTAEPREGGRIGKRRGGRRRR